MSPASSLQANRVDRNDEEQPPYPLGVNRISRPCDWPPSSSR